MLFLEGLLDEKPDDFIEIFMTRFQLLFGSLMIYGNNKRRNHESAIV